VHRLPHPDMLIHMIMDDDMYFRSHRLKTKCPDEKNEKDIV